MTQKSKTWLVFILSAVIGIAVMGLARTWIGGRVTGNVGALVDGIISGAFGVTAFFASQVIFSKLFKSSGPKS